MRDPSDIALQHWKYIKSLLETHGADKEAIRLIGFHYVTAFVHGWKHGFEEVKG